MEKCMLGWDGFLGINESIFEQIRREKNLCKQFLVEVFDFCVEKIEYVGGVHEIEELNRNRELILTVLVIPELVKEKIIRIYPSKTEKVCENSNYYWEILELEVIEGEEIIESYTIYVCKFDIFGQGRRRYTFNNPLVEILGFQLRERNTKIFWNQRNNPQII